MLWSAKANFLFFFFSLLMALIFNAIVLVYFNKMIVQNVNIVVIFLIWFSYYLSRFHVLNIFRKRLLSLQCIMSVMLSPVTNNTSPYKRLYGPHLIIKTHGLPHRSSSLASYTVNSLHLKNNAKDINIFARIILLTNMSGCDRRYINLNQWYHRMVIVYLRSASFSKNVNKYTSISSIYYSYKNRHNQRIA